MRSVAATAMAVGAAAVLLGVSGADRGPAGGSAPSAKAERLAAASERTDGPELTAGSAAGLAELRPTAPSAPGGHALRHVPVAPRPEAVRLPIGPLGIPGAAYAAYQAAANRMAVDAPACGIEWNLVAAIGRIESGHADGGNVDVAGNALTPIAGPVLDGSLAGNAVIRDGAGFARAWGPMQFLSATWALFGADGNGDGKADVQNLRDAAYGAARYLCSSASGLQNVAAQRVAVFAYNQSAAYVDNVVAWSAAYRDRAIPLGGIPDMAAPVAPPRTLPRPLPRAAIDLAACGRPGGGAAAPPSGSPRPVLTSAPLPGPAGALPIPSSTARPSGPPSASAGSPSPSTPGAPAAASPSTGAPSGGCATAPAAPPAAGTAAPSVPASSRARSAAPAPRTPSSSRGVRPPAPTTSRPSAAASSRATPGPRIRPSVSTTTTTPPPPR